MNPMDGWLWWSTGKDSAWMLHCARQEPGLNVTGLVTTLNRRFDRVAMHATRADLLRAQAGAAGHRLHLVDIPYPCSNEEYETAALRVVREGEEADVGVMLFGDLFLEDVRAYRESLLASSRIQPLFPLWGKDTSVLAREMIDAGVIAYLTCVDPNVLDPSFAGRRFDLDLLRDLPPSVDPCGERGEFHTFVSDGPMFTYPVDVEIGETVERDGFVFADVVLCE